MAGSTDDLRYKRLIKALAAGRIKAAITQADLAKKLRKSQQFISKYESGERRLDAIEFADVCYALELDPGTVLDEVAPHILTIAKKASRKTSQS